MFRHHSLSPHRASVLLLTAIIAAAMFVPASAFSQIGPIGPTPNTVQDSSITDDPQDAGSEPTGEEQSSEAAGEGDAAGEDQSALDLEAGKEEAAELFDSFGTVFEETPRLAWVLLFFGILGGLIAGKAVQYALRNLGSKLKDRDKEAAGVAFEDAASPASLALLTFGIVLGMASIRLTPQLEVFSQNVFKFLYIFATGWFFYNLVDLIDVALTKQVEKTQNKLAMQIAPLIRKALRIFIIIIFTLVIAQNVFGVNVTAWLAGLGIAGLAISLAAQDSIKNLFGSITVLLDKPFAVGDRIQFGDDDGIVEEIGFRSTRIRTFPGHLVTVPNMKFIDGTIENVSARPFIRRVMDITITYDTPPDRIDEAARIIKDMLSSGDLAEPFDADKYPARVNFTAFNADSLNIQVVYWYMLGKEGHDWWAYLDHGHKVNLALFSAYAEAGIDFAFPTQTLYLAGDPDRQLSVRVLGDPAEQTDSDAKDDRTNGAKRPNESGKGTTEDETDLGSGRSDGSTTD